jgi:hypothetical protein
VIAISVPSGNVTSTDLRLFSRAPRTGSALLRRLAEAIRQGDLGRDPIRMSDQARAHGLLELSWRDQTVDCTRS